jgi:hypothetical protein
MSSVDPFDLAKRATTASSGDFTTMSPQLTAEDWKNVDTG